MTTLQHGKILSTYFAPENPVFWTLNGHSHIHIQDTTQKIRVDIGSRVILSTKIHKSILKVKF